MAWKGNPSQCVSAKQSMLKGSTSLSVHSSACTKATSCDTEPQKCVPRLPSLTGYREMGQGAGKAPEVPLAGPLPRSQAAKGPHHVKGKHRDIKVGVLLEILDDARLDHLPTTLHHEAG